MRQDVVLFDGRQLHTLTRVTPAELADWIRAMPTPQLEAIAAVGSTSFGNVNPRPALKVIDEELATRIGRRPSRERAIDTGNDVHVRRRWQNLSPVLTNYSLGGG